MKTNLGYRPQPAHLMKNFLAGVIATVLWIQATPALRAQDRTDPPVIAYNPSLVQIEGSLPKSYTYTVGVKSPSNLPTSAPTSITLTATPTTKPASVSDATAAGYITFSPATLSFSGPDQVRNVSITLSIPVSGEPGDYNYKILSEGWPVDPEFGLTNTGTFINATVTAAAIVWTPPAVAISSPGNNSTVLVQAGGLPAIVPISFSVTSPGPYPSAIDSVTYELDGNPQPISLSSFGGIGSYSVSGSGTMTVATAGPHTVTVRGHNLGGTVTGASTFTVVVIGPPTVQIASPLANAVVAYDASGPRPAIPFSFSASSPSGSLIAYSAQLNGSNIPLSSIVGGVGTLAMTGAAVDLAGAVAGSNSLVVTATNAYGTATATSTFRVNPVSIAINTPVGGSTIVLPAGSLTGNIGFTFTTTAGSGFTVDSVSAKLDGSIANVAISSPGTGSATAVSTGTLGNVGAGSHTLTVTGVSGGVSVSASVNFTVVVIPPTPVIVIDVPSAAVINLPVGVLTGNIPFQFTTTTLAGFKIDTVSATLDNQTVSPIVSPNLGMGNNVVSTGTLSAVGAGLHTLTVNGSSGSASASTSFTFTVNVTPKANQTITFGALAAKTVGDAAFALGATASSNLAVSYTSSNNAVATVSGNMVTIVGAGTTTITASQPGNANYNAATPVTQTLTVNESAKLIVTITKPDGSLITREAGSPATVIPFSFTAVAPGGKVKTLSARLGSSSLTVTGTGLNTATATGTGTMSVSAAGFYTFTAIATTKAGFTQTVSVSFQVKETQPAPQPCVTRVVWLPPISLGKVQQGGSVLPIKFLLQQCCTDRDDDRGWRSKYRRDDDDCGSYDDDDWDNHSHYGAWDFSGGKVACRHGSDGKPKNSRDCGHDVDHDDEDRDGCANLRDKTVVISIYEIGSTAPATQYRYGTGSPNPPDYAIDGDYQYQLNFTTARGTHRYHIDVYRFQAGTTVPVLVASKEFSTK